MNGTNRSREYAASRKKDRRKRSKSGFFYFRAIICFVIIAAAAILKWTESPFINEISQTVNEGLGIDEAVEAISRAAEYDHGVLEVFGHNEPDKNVAEEAEAAFESDFYIQEGTKELEEELKSEREKQAAEASRISIENLSFEMTAEELYDDTEAVPFKIPPPSYCSYAKEKIDFKYAAPLYGVITSKYGYRDHPIIEDASFHTGLDIAAKKGSAIGAFAAGTVIERGQNSTYGNYIIIDHGSGFTSFYGHNSKVTVKKGQKVRLGQKVAEVGSTGMSTGPHLHFEVRKNNIRLDPELYISPNTI